MHFKNLGITHIDIYFQPIVSVKKQKIFGYEALLRGYKEDKYIQPGILFQEAKEAGLALALDSFVRVAAIKKFKEYFEKDTKLLLFLNFESSSINAQFEHEQYPFEETLQELSIPAKNIVLEIKEDAVESTKILKDFSSYYREKGFNIAIDDFGTGDSQFGRLAIVKPDIVKIDRSLLTHVDENAINTEILNSIAHMCHKIGAVALAEGVERENETLTSLNFGIDLFQGYFFAHPSKDEQNHDTIVHKITSVGQKHKEYIRSIIQLKIDLKNEASSLSKTLISIIKETNDREHHLIMDLLRKNQKVEALYFINVQSSKQLGDTTMITTPRAFYEPTIHGEDHSLKDYFYICKDSKSGKFISQKYISSASGNTCRTFSKRFTSDNNEELILCLDLRL